jgi:hypothetical protein
MLVDFSGSLSSLTHESSHSLSTLHLPAVSLADGGNYSCQPATLPRASLTLHVLRTEKKQNIVEKTVMASGAGGATCSWLLALLAVGQAG